MNSLWQWVGGLGTTVILYCIARPFMIRKKAPFFCVLVMFIAGCGLAMSLIGTPINWATGWISPGLLRVIAGGLLAICGLGVILDVSDYLKKKKAKAGGGKKTEAGEGNRIDQPTMWIAAVVPLLILLVPGVNSTLTPMISGIDRGADQVISQLSSGR